MVVIINFSNFLTDHPKEKAESFLCAVLYVASAAQLGHRASTVTFSVQSIHRGTHYKMAVINGCTITRVSARGFISELFGNHQHKLGQPPFSSEMPFSVIEPVNYIACSQPGGIQCSQ